MKKLVILVLALATQTAMANTECIIGHGTTTLKFFEGQNSSMVTVLSNGIQTVFSGEIAKVTDDTIDKSVSLKDHAGHEATLTIAKTLIFPKNCGRALCEDPQESKTVQFNYLGNDLTFAACHEIP